MSPLLLSILDFVLTVIFLLLGGILLLAGRKYLWIMLAIAGFLITATVAAEIQGYPAAWSLVVAGEWISILIALGAAVLGGIIGLNYQKIAIDVVGFGVGIFVASWFDEILLVLTNQESDGFTWWVAALFIIAGLVGVLITRQDPDQALILISVILGAKTISDALALDQSRSTTAVITLALALTGVVVQYAAYLREQPRIGRQLPPVPHPIDDELPYE